MRIPEIQLDPGRYAVLKSIACAQISDGTIPITKLELELTVLEHVAVELESEWTTYS